MTTAQKEMVHGDLYTLKSVCENLSKICQNRENLKKSSKRKAYCFNNLMK